MEDKRKLGMKRDCAKIKINCTNVNEIRNAIPASIYGAIIVEDIYENEYCIFTDGLTEDSTYVFSHSKNGDNGFLQIKNIAYGYNGYAIQLRDNELGDIRESETSNYDPPKFAILPALDDDGEPNDKIEKYIRGELKKRKVYFRPSIQI